MNYFDPILISNKSEAPPVQKLGFRGRGGRREGFGRRELVGEGVVQVAIVNFRFSIQIKSKGV